MTTYYSVGIRYKDGAWERCNKVNEITENDIPNVKLNEITELNFVESKSRYYVFKDRFVAECFFRGLVLGKISEQHPEDLYQEMVDTYIGQNNA